MNINTRADLQRYLEATWSGHFGGPMTTLRSLSQKKGLFEVPHLVMTYLDFLARLDDGDPLVERIAGIEHFLRRYFDAKYHSAAELLVDMYRHGLVHRYKPQSFALNDGTVVEWVCSVGETNRAMHLHTVPLPESPGSIGLLINAPQLVDDMYAAINRFRDVLLHDHARADRAIKALDAIDQPIPCNAGRSARIASQLASLPKGRIIQPPTC